MSRSGSPIEPAEDEAPPPETVRAELARLLASPRLARAPRLCELLRYVVERTLAGEADGIKGYTIAMDVFGRGAQFDAAGDSLVRVEMGRLRRALEAHYAAEGRDSPLMIVIPRGTYVPRFVRRWPPTAPTEAEMPAAAESGAVACRNTEDGAPAAVRGAGRVTPVEAVALMALALAVAVVVALLAHGRQQQRLADIAEAAAGLADGPSVAVLPIAADPGDETARFLAEGLAIDLSGRLAAFRRLVVLAPESATRLAGLPRLPASIRRRYPALFALRGRLRRTAGGLHLDMTLVDLSSGRVVWSRAYDAPAAPDRLEATVAALATTIAATLGQGEGVIERVVTGGPLARVKSLDSFVCVARFHRYLRHKSAAAHRRTRACLERTVAREACYAAAWAALSWIHADEARLGYNPRRGAEPPLARALKAGERAVACDPEDATAWLHRGKVFFALYQDAAARADIARALELNPGDANLLAHAGTTLALLGDWRRGMALMDKAFHLNPFAPRWYHGIRFLDAWRRGDVKAAVAEARAYFRPGILLSHGYLVAALARAGRREEAAAARRRMREAFPDAGAALAKQMRLWRVPPDLAAELEAAVAGVAGAGQG